VRPRETFWSQLDRPTGRQGLCGKAQPFRPNGQKEKTKKSLSLRLLPGKPEAFHTAGSKAAIFHTFPANKPTAFK